MKNNSKIYLLNNTSANIFISIFISFIYFIGNYIYQFFYPNSDDSIHSILKLAIVSILLIVIFLLLIITRLLIKFIFKKIFIIIPIITITSITQAFFNISFVFVTISIFYGQNINNFILNSIWFLISLPIFYFILMQLSGYIFEKKLTFWFMITLLITFLLSSITDSYFNYSNIILEYLGSISMGMLGIIFTPNLTKYLENWFNELKPT